MALGIVIHQQPYPGWADVWRAGPPGLRSRCVTLLRLSHAGADETLALPALKRLIRVEALSRSAKALLPRT